MICCLNPDCSNPQNPDHHQLCQTCHTPLVPLLRNRFRVLRVLSDEGGFGRTYISEDIDKLNVDDEIEIICKNDEKKILNIIEKNEDTIKINESIEGEECFITGSKVDDFHTLDKNYIYTLNVCATQELYKLIQKQNEIIENLQLQINELKNNL